MSHSFCQLWINKFTTNSFSYTDNNEHHKKSPVIDTVTPFLRYPQHWPLALQASQDKRRGEQRLDNAHHLQDKKTNVKITTPSTIPTASPSNSTEDTMFPTFTTVAINLTKAAVTAVTNSEATTLTTLTTGNFETVTKAPSTHTSESTRPISRYNQLKVNSNTKRPLNAGTGTHSSTTSNFPQISTPEVPLTENSGDSETLITMTTSRLGVTKIHTSTNPLLRPFTMKPVHLIVSSKRHADIVPPQPHPANTPDDISQNMKRIGNEKIIGYKLDKVSTVESVNTFISDTVKVCCDERQNLPDRPRNTSNMTIKVAVGKVSVSDTYENSGVSDAMKYNVTSPHNKSVISMSPSADAILKAPVENSQIPSPLTRVQIKVPSPPVPVRAIKRPIRPLLRRYHSNYTPLPRGPVRTQMSHQRKTERKAVISNNQSNPHRYHYSNHSLRNPIRRRKIRVRRPSSQQFFKSGVHQEQLLEHLAPSSSQEAQPKLIQEVLPQFNPTSRLEFTLFESLKRQNENSTKNILPQFNPTSSMVFPVMQPIDRTSNNTKRDRYVEEEIGLITQPRPKEEPEVYIPGNQLVTDSHTKEIFPGASTGHTEQLVYPESGEQSLSNTTKSLDVAIIQKLISETTTEQFSEDTEGIAENIHTSLLTQTLLSTAVLHKKYDEDSATLPSIATSSTPEEIIEYETTTSVPFISIADTGPTSSYTDTTTLPALTEIKSDSIETLSTIPTSSITNSEGIVTVTGENIEPVTSSYRTDNFTASFISTEKLVPNKYNSRVHQLHDLKVPSSDTNRTTLNATEIPNIKNETVMYQENSLNNASQYQNEGETDDTETLLPYVSLLHLAVPSLKPTETVKINANIESDATPTISGPLYQGTQSRRRPVWTQPSPPRRHTWRPKRPLHNQQRVSTAQLINTTHQTLHAPLVLTSQHQMPEKLLHPQAYQKLSAQLYTTPSTPPPKMTLPGDTKQPGNSKHIPASSVLTESERLVKNIFSTLPDFLKGSVRVDQANLHNHTNVGMSNSYGNVIYQQTGITFIDEKAKE